ncbi:hypothetical protein AAMO2058_001419700 [Amorphochlora amoebiformis]|uniref:Globin domain-containing protein n=1 Tax=Amorphochlora amoebiformis TaxID=1561963 RepID=A0A7S0GS31_9EUKA|mmetsp:Transcript_13601/g.21495  ORF Transcript_13601/g.21495 Transcript_13601/m.21495 type:complete len:183 (+) Transcript_13601:400-948(+)
MGNESSSPAFRYRKELLKLSWRLVLTVQEQAASHQASRAQSHTSDLNATKADGKSALSISLVAGKEGIKPFHEDFEASFFKYCPDLKTKFPSNYSLVSKMIQSFISNAIECKDISKLARNFGKSHKQHQLTNEHFEGFASALVDTIQSRLGKFGTIELVKIWREVTVGLVKAMQKEYKKATK